MKTCRTCIHFLPENLMRIDLQDLGFIGSCTHPNIFLRFIFLTREHGEWLCGRHKDRDSK